MKSLQLCIKMLRWCDGLFPITQTKILCNSNSLYTDAQHIMQYMYVNVARVQYQKVYCIETLPVCVVCIVIGRQIWSEQYWHLWSVDKLLHQFGNKYTESVYGKRTSKRRTIIKMLHTQNEKVAGPISHQMRQQLLTFPSGWYNYETSLRSI